ncbi:MAG: SpoIID/LytB domain-containing protein [Oscillospiraceae bacterium]
MEIKLMSLGLELSPDIVESQAMVETTIGKLFDQTVKFDSFNSEKLFITELSNAVKQEDIIVLAAESELFLPFKSFIAKAFQIKKKINKQIAKQIRSVHPEIKPDSDQFEGQATIPVGAVPLLSDDGMFSGFAIKSNQRIVIVIPFDIDRLDTILNKEVTSYLAQALPDIIKVVEEVKEEPAKTLFNERLISETTEKLLKKKSKVAFADTKTVDFIAVVANSIKELLSVLMVSDFSLEKGQMPTREYAIRLARGARESLNTPIGACITNVFTVNKEDGSTDMFIYSCIADGAQANAIKVYAKQGETLPELVFHAINELFKMIYSWADTGKVIPPIPEKPKDEKELQKEKTSRKHKKQIQIIVSVMLVVSIVASFLVCTFVDDIYNIRGTLAQKEQSQLNTDDLAKPDVENADANAINNNSESSDEHGGLELDSVFIDYINQQSTSKPGSTQGSNKTTTKKPTTNKGTGSANTDKKPNNTEPITPPTPVVPPNSTYPATLVLDGASVDTAIAIARIVEGEMGKSFSTEALKAQAVAVFSYIKCNNWNTGGLARKASYSDKVMQAVQAVLGQTVTYNGKTALTSFFAMSAGKTVSSNTVWNTNNSVPYLSGGIVSNEKSSGLSGYQTTKTYSSADMKTMIENKIGVTLGNDPKSWITINSHDSSVNADVGYISSMTVGGKTISGHVFRSSVLGYGIRSHCFSVAYSAESDSFTLTVYGYGHGVGMSQQGANFYAKQGWDYKRILSHYFPGTQIG